MLNMFNCSELMTDKRQFHFICKHFKKVKFFTLFQLVFATSHLKNNNTIDMPKLIL